MHVATYLGLTALVSRCVSGGNKGAIGSVEGVFGVIVGGMRRHEAVAEVLLWGCRALGYLALNHGELRHRSRVNVHVTAGGGEGMGLCDCLCCVPALTSCV